MSRPKMDEDVFKIRYKRNRWLGDTATDVWYGSDPVAYEARLIAWGDRVVAHGRFSRASWSDTVG